MSTPFINFFHRPGEGFSDIYVFSSKTELKVGRPVQNSYKLIGSFKGIVSSTLTKEKAAPEKEKWKSSEHSVSHNILQRGKPEFTVSPNDILTIGVDDLSKAEKKYFVKGKPYNPANINHFTVYPCEERTGIV